MLVSIISKRHLKWFGQVTRHNDKLPSANNILHGKAPGKGGRGRPRISWIHFHVFHIFKESGPSVRTDFQGDYQGDKTYRPSETTPVYQQ